MTLANGLFAQVLDYLVKEKMVKDQQELASVTGITETTISRILNDKVRQPSKDTWQKLNKAFGNIFNPQYFRGESTVMLIADLVPDPINQQPQIPSALNVDFSSYINALIAKSDETIASLKREIEAKEEIIHAKDERIADLEKLADERLHRIAELRRVIDSNNYNIDSPFPMGIAEDRNKHNKVRV